MWASNRDCVSELPSCIPSDTLLFVGGTDASVLRGSVLVLRGDMQPLLVFWLCRGASLLQDICWLMVWSVF